MSRVSIYLNFPNQTEIVFNYYKEIFGGEFGNDGIVRMGEMPATEGFPPLSDEEKKLVMHVELEILNSLVLMGTDAPESMGFNINFGNNIYINLEPDSKEETQRLFNLLSSEGKILQDLDDMFWGAYYGSCIDKFGIHWMFNFTNIK